MTRYEKKFVEEALAKRLAEFFEVTRLQRDGSTGTPVSLPEAYVKRQSCIDKLLMVCYGLRVSTKKAIAAIAPLMGERISPAKITQVAMNLDRELAAYHRRRVRKTGDVLGRLNKRDRQVTNALEKLSRPANLQPHPRTLAALEKDLNNLLTFFRTVQPKLWPRLHTPGANREPLAKKEKG